MIKTLINAWKVADIRKKLLFTAFIVLVFRIGSVIPVPFLNIVDEISIGKGNNILTYLSLMTGSAFTYGTIFAMSITPYINASIIMQLLAVAIPPLERLQKEGEEGRKKIATITRFVTVGLGLLQSLAYYFYLRANGYLMMDANGAAFTGFDGVFQAIVIVMVLTAGTAVIMWLGEQITISGIGNGISIILFAGIISRFPTLIQQLFQYINTGRTVYKILVPIVCVCFLLMIAYIVFMDNSERRLTVTYAKRVVGRKMMGGQSSHMPIKVNMSGVLPVIFASSILSLPATVQMFIDASKYEGTFWEKFFNAFQSDSWVYAILYFLLIIFFAYFYSTIQYNPIEMANNLRKNNGALPGFRPGKPTSNHIMKVLSRLTLIGALMLSVIALFPIVYSIICEAAIPPLTEGGSDGGMTITLGGTSLIIMCGVALETVRQLESQMMMRHYKGFLD
ncbi:MAG: preprotein translocase subunit SecY [Acetobacter sp.]|nr:preprotein translocase subunit SecY [Bacteroides sp.]MCM1342000.1 preprotein translocase subunit SecY [Acetobacter sp.]MCM1434203.1 preprotein translocase subunit SecY [Clostridiales bacterium]